MTMTPIFNNQGELNASSVREAFAQISKLAAAMENVPSGATLTSPVASDPRRDELIARAMTSEQGKLALAASMASPIRF